MSALVEEVRAARQFRPRVAKAIREAAGISQQRIADELGVHRVSVARWESGERRPVGEIAGRYFALLDGIQRAGEL